ncbi:MAG: radical SAM protein [Bacteroidaceae bacterium]|nr:radical SAM protein [Bacteroidaceae bacterium]
MGTVLHDGPVFGPVRSRRLGVSLGINLLPTDGKWCSFDCVYCECGLNAERRSHQPLPTAEEVERKLVERLQAMAAEGVRPDVLTFAGNGEPTLHPDFPDIARRVMRVRDTYCPEAKVSILSNATQLRRAEVRETLCIFDNNILKLDTVDAAYIQRVDRPAGHYDVEEQVRLLADFDGNLIIQTMFMGGQLHGVSVDNTGEEFLAPYLEALARIRPRQVMVYTIDRETPYAGLEKAPRATLDAIAERIRQLGLEVSVSY